MNEKTIRICKKMKDDNIDIAFFNNPIVINFLTGYKSEPHERILAAILFADAPPLLFTPGLEFEDAKRLTTGFDVFSYQDTENPWLVLKDKLDSLDLPIQNWAIEKDYLTVARKEALERAFSNSQFDYDFSPFLEELRLQKTADELVLMEKAGYWADEAIKIGARTLKVGVTETEVVAQIEYELKKRGISEMSFDTMVLFGDNAASPHGEPGSRQLKENEFVLFDLGVMYKGYASDVTRTLFFGDKPTDHQSHIYHLVLEAHDQAMKQASLSLTAEELDAIARDVIDSEGYGQYFNHRLGHGLGQSVHEFPSLMKGNTMKLEKNMCFSIEPGIYIPNDIGVRVEDCGYLDESGFHSFTSFPTDIAAYKTFILSEQ